MWDTIELQVEEVIRMATDSTVSRSDAELLRDYLDERIDREDPDLSLDDALAGFQAYHRQLQDLRAKVRQAEDSLARGEGRPLDVEAIIGRVRKRLTEQGVDGVRDYDRLFRAP